MEYLSKQRYDELVAELNHLINVVYPEVGKTSRKPVRREIEARMQGTVKPGSELRAVRVF